MRSASRLGCRKYPPKTCQALILSAKAIGVKVLATNIPAEAPPVEAIIVRTIFYRILDMCLCSLLHQCRYSISAASPNFTVRRLDVFDAHVNVSDIYAIDFRWSACALQSYRLTRNAINENEILNCETACPVSDPLRDATATAIPDFSTRQPIAPDFARFGINILKASINAEKCWIVDEVSRGLTGLRCRRSKYRICYDSGEE